MNQQIQKRQASALDRAKVALAHGAHAILKAFGRLQGGYRSRLDPNKEERDATPVFVRNACECRICGAPADRHGSIFQCQKAPGHIADTMTGIFSDLSWPPRVEKK